jgi:hypothetical protein
MLDWIVQEAAARTLEAQLQVALTPPEQRKRRIADTGQQCDRAATSVPPPGGTPHQPEKSGYAARFR